MPLKLGSLCTKSLIARHLPLLTQNDSYTSAHILLKLLSQRAYHSPVHFLGSAMHSILARFPRSGEIFKATVKQFYQLQFVKS